MNARNLKLIEWSQWLSILFIAVIAILHINPIKAGTVGSKYEFKIDYLVAIVKIAGANGSGKTDQKTRLKIPLKTISRMY